jgi:hypothetical protein
MTLMTAPPEPGSLGALDEDLADGPVPPPPAPTRRRSRPWLWTLVTMVGLVLLAIPLGLQTRDGLTTTGPTVGAMPQEANGRPAGPAVSPDTSGPGTAERGRTTGTPGTDQSVPATPQEPVTGPRLARSAWLGLKVTDVTASASSVRTITGRADGQVLSEDVVTSPGPRGETGVGNIEPDSLPGASVSTNEARLVLRVPTGALDRVLVDLSGVGTVSYRSSRSADVTDSYVDTAARIETMEQAVRQARALLAKATDLGQIIDLENEVTRRQADLDSLRARLADLERRTTTADVTVTLWTDATERPSPAPSGFLSGLHDAWTGFLSSVGVIVTGLAVLLPWLFVGLAVALPVRAWLRRRRPTPTTPATTTPATTTPATTPPATTPPAGTD